MSVVFGLLHVKMFKVTKKRSALILGKAIRVRFSGNGQKGLHKFENTQLPLE